MRSDQVPSVGTRSRSSSRVATGEPAHAALLRMLDEVRPATTAELASLRWDRQAAANDGPVQLSATVTRRVPSHDGAVASIHQALELVDDDGGAVGRAAAVWEVAVPLSESTARQWEEADFASVRWGQQLRARLNADAAFTSATRGFDGAIALLAPARQVQFRIYRGVVIEAARKAVDGATFAVESDELTWLELLTSPTNDFIRRTSDGRFRVSGSGYQYLRMIKAVVLMIDQARAMTTEAAHA